jgi:arginyl-tRNA synthetase
LIDPRTLLADSLRSAIARVAPGSVPPALTLERSKQAQHGDYASNAALQLAKVL